MQSTYVSKNDTELIDLGSKKFHKYPTPTDRFELKKTILNGRSPEDPGKAYKESAPFALFILKGEGTLILDGTSYVLSPEDVVYVMENSTWSLEGDLEYVVCNVPVWKPEQMSEVSAE